MAKRRYVAQLERVPRLQLGNADIEFGVRSAGKHYGMLAISRGALVWRPARERFEYRIPWPRLHEFARGFRPLRRARSGNLRRT